MNYTKGKWKVTDNELETLTTGDSIRIGCIKDNGSLDLHVAFTGGRTVEENIANAHLIAAAPDLLHALNVVYREALRLNNDGCAFLIRRETLEKIKKAINKAEGKDE